MVVHSQQSAVRPRGLIMKDPSRCVCGRTDNWPSDEAAITPGKAIAGSPIYFIAHNPSMRTHAESERVKVG